MGHRAIIYTRLSREAENGTERSREDQLADCEALASARGYEVGGRYTDLESAWKPGAVRPGFDAMLDAIRAGEADVVVAWRLDRLTRGGVRAIGPLLDALDAGGASLVTVHGDVDTTTAMGEGMLGLLASVARAESEGISLRVRRAKEHHATNGRHKDGGPRPFGLTADWSEIVPAEAEAIREAASRILAGESLRGIVLDWRERGLLTSTGRQWSAQGLRQLLRQRRLVGEREHRGEVVGDGQWPAILDPATGAKLRAILDDPSRCTPGKSRHLLTGLVRCERCGTKMRTVAPGGVRRYSCPPKPEGCNGCRILAEPLEELITEAVLLRLDSPALATRLTEANHDDDPADELGTLRDRLDELADSFAAGEITRREWLRAREGIEARITDAERTLRRSSTAAALDLGDEPVQDAWAGSSLERRRAVLAAVVERVTIGPALRGRNRFDPERVDMTWRA